MPSLPLCHGHSGLQTFFPLHSFAAGPRDCPGPASSTNSSPNSSPGSSSGLGRNGCHGNPEVVLLAQRPPGVVVPSVPHNMAPLGPCVRPPPATPRAFTLVPTDGTPPSRCSGPQSHQGLPFPHFIASAGAVSVFCACGAEAEAPPTPRAWAWCGRSAASLTTPPSTGHTPLLPWQRGGGGAPQPPKIKGWVHRCGRGQVHGCGTGRGRQYRCGHRRGRGRHPGWPGAPPRAGGTRVVTSARDPPLPPRP